MTESDVERWTDRAAARSPLVAKSRSRSIQRARQIVDAAMELIPEKGTGFTIQELCRHAEVALQTFYRHFNGKDDLMLAVLERQIVEAVAAFEQSAEHLRDPLQRLRFFITTTIALAGGSDNGANGGQFITSEHFRLEQLFPKELLQVQSVYARLLIPEIQAGVDAGRLAVRDVDTSAWFITQLVVATFHHYAFLDAAGTIDAIADDLWLFCLQALGGSAKDPALRRAPRPR